jgi:hypothetical protein
MYRALLGDAWSELPEAVRAVHLPGEIQGSLEVTWGRGWFARLLARLLGFPRPGREVPVTLSIEARADASLWRRRIGQVLLVTEQWFEAGLVLERLGGIVCAFELQGDANGVRYSQRFATLRFGPLALRLPRWLTPRVLARVSRVPEGALTEVEIQAPLAGMILRYAGKVTRVSPLPQEEP